MSDRSPSLALEHLAPCFQGLIPATLFTCSADGVPNVAYLSHVDYVDSTHVALSFQFFSKSRRNVAENPFALVRVIDPDTKRGYDLHLRFERSEAEGALFESMRLRIEAIASFSGLKGIFKLLAADVYEVVAIEEAAEEPGDLEDPEDRRERASAEQAALFSMTALQALASRIHRAGSLDHLLDTVLDALEDLFNFRHSMMLLASEHADRVVAVATRGYDGKGVGAEVGFGEGIIGMAAEAREPIRISGLLREMLYAAAVREEASKRGLDPRHRRVRLPGLEEPQSLLAVPLIAGEELLGVLFAESQEPYRFHEHDKACIVILGSYIAIAIQNALLRARIEDQEPGSPAASANGAAVSRTLASPLSPAGANNAARHEVVFYRSDECILVDGEYLVRSLPAKILWRLLTIHRCEGRREFTNRELRLDKSLALPAYKDNLETRLLLLRRRLEQRCPDLRLVPLARGRFGLELQCELDLVERD